MVSTGKARLSTDSVNITLPKITDNSTWLYYGSEMLGKLRFVRFLEFPTLVLTAVSPFFLPYALGFAGLYVLFLRVS